MERTIPKAEYRNLLLNGIFGPIGIVIMFIGLCGLLYSLYTFDYTTAYYLSGDLEKTKGVLVKNIVTDILTFSSEYLVENVYKFDSPIGELQSYSYSYGLKHYPGDTVTVEYHLQKPYINRIEGLDHNVPIYSKYVFLIVILIGYSWLKSNIKTGRRKINILLNGTITKGKLIAKKKSENSETIPSYKMTFVFIAHNGLKYRTSVWTYMPRKFEDEKFEKLIYNPDNPKQAYLVDKLPGSLPKHIKRNWM